MPKKIKKKKKGAKSEANEGPTSEGDPSTMIGGDSGKKKKKKKTKLTKAEKAAQKMEKAIALFKSNGENYLNFIDRMHRWMLRNFAAAMTLFHHINKNEDMIVSYDEFKAGMRDLDVPCNTVELHLLTLMLDRNNTEKIEYGSFAKGLTFVREREDGVYSSSDDEELDLDGDDAEMRPDKDDDDEQIDGNIQLQLTQRIFPKCVCCGMSVCEPYKEKNPRFIDLELRLITFEKFANYPGHLNLLVHSHISIEGVIGSIKEHAGTASRRIYVFRSATFSDEDLLAINTTMEDNGFPGGTYTNPETVRLFYDYSPEFRDCPILTCDHYFLK